VTTPLIPPAIDATLVLVRHGESTWIAEDRFQGRRDPPLSPRGERQAALVAARLADPLASPSLPIPAGPPVAIWHSPLGRAQATATAIAAAAAVSAGRPPLVPEPGLSEIGQGEWEGLLSTDVVERYADDLGRWRRAPVGNEAPGGELLTEADGRVRTALAGMLPVLAGAAQASVEQASLAVDLWRSPVPGYGPPPPLRPWGVVVGHEGVFRLTLLALLDLPLERFWAFPFVLGGVTVVDLRQGRAVLRAHNLADHLAPLAVEEASEPRRA
jgi:broad specificity phosphatase PhoE